MILSEAERQEAAQLRWLHQYWADSWLATMRVLDTIRPSMECLRDVYVQITKSLDEGGDMGEAQWSELAALRKWHEEYQATVQRLALDKYRSQ